MKTLTIEPLEQASFARFGDVIDTQRSDGQTYPINDGYTRRHHGLSAIVAQGAGPILSVFVTQSFGFPLQIRMLERHPRGSQAFIPIGSTAMHDFLVVVAEGEPSPDPATLRVFRASGGQGVNVHAGVWHHPNIVLEGSQSFLVVDREQPSSNLEEYTFPATVRPIWLKL